MTTTHPNVNEYFATFSSISKKIVQDCDVIKNSFGDDWDNFSTEEREQELWNNLVHPDISEKYSSYPQPEDMQDVFPRLKIECGEKIVIDFDNDEVSIISLYKFGRVCTIETSYNCLEINIL